MLVAAGAVPLPKASSVMTPEQLAACVGDYHSETGRDLALSVEDGRLLLASQGRDKLELSPKGGGVFLVIGAGGLTITFNMEGATVTGVTVKPPDAGTVFKKVAKGATP